jgi:hypothetical protein
MRALRLNRAVRWSQGTGISRKDANHANVAEDSLLLIPLGVLRLGVKDWCFAKCLTWNPSSARNVVTWSRESNRCAGEYSFCACSSAITHVDVLGDYSAPRNDLPALSPNQGTG